MMRILGVDVGTTAMKMGVFDGTDDSVALVRQFSQEYTINTYNDGLFSDIEPQKWQQAFIAGCGALGELLSTVDVVALSGTTPGFTAMDAEGKPLYPAILMLDQRSRQQAQKIIDTVGIETLLAETANMPVAGGCSLASLLWMKDNLPDLYNRTAVFGHSNTFMAKWLTGSFAIDPSSASLTALYNTVKNDRSWNGQIAGAFDISLDHLPPVIAAHESPGRLRPGLASELGLTKEPPVVIGGNDAVLAAYSLGVEEPGETMNINGTCEITLVCLPRCYPSRNYNIRCHAVTGRWLTLYVMNALGVAYEWFRKLFCSEMPYDVFYGSFMPEAVDGWLERESGVTYIPYLMGSRYFLAPLRAEFLGLTQETSREEMMAALVRGLCLYQREHLKEIALEIPLADEIHITGGALNPSLIRAKAKWMRACRYVFEEQSSLKGAALLGRKYLQSIDGQDSPESFESGGVSRAGAAVANSS
ncbi:MAG: FGGY family carbohydrate kinase [Deltaproteobacteria bacterium]